MKKCLITAAILFSTYIVIAQGRVGINTTNPLAMFHVKDSSVVFTGQLNGPFPAGPPPVSGAGRRLMWYVDKFAFRVGNIDASNSTSWDKDSIGFGSFASGLNTKALGSYSFAAGNSSSAKGSGSIAMGSYCNTLSDNCISLGTDSRSSGLGSISIGYSSFADADFSTAIGNVTQTFSSGSTVLGFGNDPILNTSSPYLPSDPILIIGNGGLSTKSNAFAISRDARAFIDPQNKNTGSLDDNALLFGGYNNTGEGISSKRTSGGNQWGLDFYTNNTARLTITNNGAIGIGTATPLHNLDVNGRMHLANGVIQRGGTAITGTSDLGLYSRVAGDYIRVVTNNGSIRFYSDDGTGTTANIAIEPNGKVGIGNVSPAEKLDVTGNIKATGNVTVQNGKGIIRSSDAAQQKVVKTIFTLNNVALAANATTSFSISWSEAFSAVPMAYVGNIVSGTSGVAETMLVLSNVTATGATVWVHNTNNSGLTANFTVNLIAIGAQ